MTVTLIAAHAENGVLSSGGRLPWHLPDEVQHFRTCCAGKWILAGRRTWAEMDGWFKPDQTPVIVTRDPAALRVPHGFAVAGVPEGLALAREQGAEECVVIGGGRVFAEAMPFAHRLILTVVHAIIPGDVFFPPLPPHTWRETTSTYHPADGSHAYAYTIRCLIRADS